MRYSMTVVAAVMFPLAALAAMPAPVTSELRVATWNVWGVGSAAIWKLGGDRDPNDDETGDIGWDSSRQRVEHAARYVFAPLRPHVIGLQEVAMKVDANFGPCWEAHAQNEQIEDQFLKTLKATTGGNYRIAWFVREHSGSMWDASMGACYLRRGIALIYDAAVLTPVTKVAVCLNPNVGLDDCPAQKIVRRSRTEVFKNDTQAKRYQVCRNEAQDGPAPDGLGTKNGGEFCVNYQKGINAPTSQEAGSQELAHLVGGEFRHKDGAYVSVYNLHPSADVDSSLVPVAQYITKVERQLDAYAQRTGQTRLPPIVLGDFNDRLREIHAVFGYAAGAITAGTLQYNRLSAWDACGTLDPALVVVLQQLTSLGMQLYDADGFFLAEPSGLSCAIDHVLLGRAENFVPLSIGGYYEYPGASITTSSDPDHFWHEALHRWEVDPDHGRLHSDHPAIVKTFTIETLHEP